MYVNKSLNGHQTFSREGGVLERDYLKVFKGTNFFDLKNSQNLKTAKLRRMRKWRSVIFHAHAQSAQVRAARGFLVRVPLTH